jgi:hypothetical protein
VYKSHASDPGELTLNLNLPASDPGELTLKLILPAPDPGELTLKLTVWIGVGFIWIMGFVFFLGFVCQLLWTCGDKWLWLKLWVEGVEVKTGSPVKWLSWVMLAQCVLLV